MRRKEWRSLSEDAKRKFHELFGADKARKICEALREQERAKAGIKETIRNSVLLP